MWWKLQTFLESVWLWGRAILGPLTIIAAIVFAFLSFNPYSEVARFSLLWALAVIVVLTILRYLVLDRIFILGILEVRLRFFLRRQVLYLAFAAAVIAVMISLRTTWIDALPLFVAAVLLVLLKHYVSIKERFIAVAYKHQHKLGQIERGDAEARALTLKEEERENLPSLAGIDAFTIAVEASPKEALKLRLGSYSDVAGVMAALWYFNQKRNEDGRVADEWKPISARIAVNYVRNQKSSPFEETLKNMDEGVSTMAMLTPGVMAPLFEFYDLALILMTALFVKAGFDPFLAQSAVFPWFDVIAGLGAGAVLMLLIRTRKVWGKLRAKACVGCGKATHLKQRLFGVKMPVCCRECFTAVNDYMVV